MKIPFSKLVGWLTSLLAIVGAMNETQVADFISKVLAVFSDTPHVALANAAAIIVIAVVGVISRFSHAANGTGGTAPTTATSAKTVGLLDNLTSR